MAIAQRSTNPSSFGMKTENILSTPSMSEQLMNYQLRGATVFNESNKGPVDGHFSYTEDSFFNSTFVDSLLKPMEHNVNKAIKISRGIVVGFGKVKIPKTQELNHDIPLLSFVNIHESTSSFVSTCIPLRIDGYGRTIEEAEEDMVESIYYFLNENFKKLSLEDAWENINDLEQLDDWSNELWDAYNKAETQLKTEGRTKDNVATLSMRLDKLEKLVKELESRLKKEDLEKARFGFASEMRKLAKYLIVDKTDLAAVI